MSVHAKSAASVDPAALGALVARSRRDVEDGTLPSVQIALARHGELLVSETFGAPSDARYVLLSVTKALTASVAWLLIGRSELTDTTCVADLVPEFRDGGKEKVLVEHLLTHTAGFARAPMLPLEGADPTQRRARFEKWRLDWEPGSRTEYHATSAHWVLADLVERVTGRDHREVFNADVADALGLTSMRLGPALDDQQNVVELTIVGGDPAPGQGLADHILETTESQLLRFNDPAVRTAGVPGAGAVSSAADVALLYQAFLHNPNERWDPAVLADATGNIRNRHPDPLMGVPANRTLGLVVAGDDGMGVVRQFGRSTGPRAFGAAGVGGQTAWADPDSGLSFCYLTSGLESDPLVSFKRSAKIAGLAGRCIGVHDEARGPDASQSDPVARPPSPT